MTGSRRTVSERLADHVVDLRFEDLPAPVVAKVKDHVLHSFGVALAAHRSEDARRAVDLAHRLSEDGGTCTIIGESRRAKPLDAVFANASLMTHQNLDDFQLPSGVHPGAVTQPVAWATGELRRASGRELLVALVVGYDAGTKLANAAWSWDLPAPRRPSSVVGSIAAAATAARLHGLQRAQTATALGHAANASVGLVEASNFDDPPHGLLARNGLMATFMASAGMGMSRTMIEGEHGLFHAFVGSVPDRLEDELATLGAEFEIMRTMTKHYRASGLNIVPIEMTLELVRVQPIEVSKLTSVTLTLPRERRQREAVWERALTSSTADSTSRAGSLRFQIACILADGAIEPARYERPPDPDLAEILSKIQLRFEPDRPITYGRLEVTTVDGQRYVDEDIERVPVHPHWSDWFGPRRQQVLTDDDVASLLDAVANLEDLGDVSAVMRCVTPAD